jgi:hypothetical protein
MLLALFKPGGVTWCPSKLVSLRNRLILGGSLKIHRPFPTILVTFHTYFPPSPHPFGIFGCIDPRRDCTLPHGKKGLKAQRVKVAWRKDKILSFTFEMIHPRIPEKEVKRFSTINRGPTKIITQGVSLGIGGLITSQPIMIIGA